MPQVAISTEQLQELQNRVVELIDDKQAADNATWESTAAHVALQQAQADVATKDAAEADLDEVVGQDVTELQVFIGTLVKPPV